MANPRAHFTGLEKASAQEMMQLWGQHFDTNMPVRLRRDLIIHLLSYRIQEQAHGSGARRHGGQGRIRPL